MRVEYAYKVNGRYITPNEGFSKDIDKAYMFSASGMSWVADKPQGKMVKVKVIREEMKDEQVS